VGLAANIRVDTHQHRLALRAPVAALALRDQPAEALDLVEVVDHDQPDAVSQGHAQLGLGLGVAVHHDPLRREAGRQREVQLAAGGGIAPEPLAGEQRQHGGAREGLGGEHDVHVRVQPPGGACEGPRAGLQIVLGDDVCGRAKRAGELERVAAADLEHAPLVEAAAQWKHW